MRTSEKATDAAFCPGDQQSGSGPHDGSKQGERVSVSVVSEEG